MSTKILKNFNTKKSCKACVGGKLWHSQTYDDANREYVSKEYCNICGYEQPVNEK